MMMKNESQHESASSLMFKEWVAENTVTKVVIQKKNQTQRDTIGKATQSRPIAKSI
jgi:hypothetical protein